MPARNVIKEYVEGGYYHVYNRGVEKRKIFESKQDYGTFLGYLKHYLSPPETPPNRTIEDNGHKYILSSRQPKNYSTSIDLLAYSLMPNHFHFLIKQHTKTSMGEFMQSLCTRYTMYFNKQHKRVGKLFQGVYRAVRIKNDNQLLHLSRYIHLNPLKKSSTVTKRSLLSQPSSYPDYLQTRNTSWVKANNILEFFANQPHVSYQKFVESFIGEEDASIVGLTLDSPTR